MNWPGIEPPAEEPTPPDVDDVDQVVDEADEVDEGELYFADLEEFVTDFFAVTFRRDLSASTVTWCPEWWAHPEGVYRLDALWRAWEHLRTDAALGSLTWLEHLDRQLPTLLSHAGPFRGCSPEDGHQELRDLRLPCDPAPPAWA